MKNAEFLKTLLEANGTMQLTSTFMMVRDDQAMETVRLSQILNMDESKILGDGQKIIDILETDTDLPLRSMYIKLKWKILALVTVQDAFSGVIHADMDSKEFGTRNYFYYESLHLLREYFYCGFNNYLSSSQHLLRTILEFNIKQVYFDKICMQQGAFEPLRKHLKDGIAPEPAKMVTRILPQDTDAKPLKKQVQFVLKGLSKSSSHSYAPIHSIRGNGRLQHEYSIDSLFFWATLLVLLDSVLWLYYFHYPQLFNPKNVATKFGFSPPVGCFITKTQAIAIDKSLSENDRKFFKDRAMSSGEIASLNHFYDQQKSMTKKQILDSWDQEDGKRPTTIEGGYFATITKMRAIQEVTANAASIEESSKDDELEKLHKLFSNVTNYEWWRHHYKNFK